MTVEVGDISIEGDLALELGAMEARAALPRPEDVLGAGHPLAKGADKLAALGRDRRDPYP